MPGKKVVSIVTFNDRAGMHVDIAAQFIAHELVSTGLNGLGKEAAKEMCRDAVVLANMLIDTVEEFNTKYAEGT